MLQEIRTNCTPRKLFVHEGSKSIQLSASLCIHKLPPFTNRTQQLTSGINYGLAKFKRLVAFLLLGRLSLSLAVFIGRFRKQLLDVRVEADAQMRVDGGDALLQLGEEGHFVCGVKRRCASLIGGGVAGALSGAKETKVE